MNEYLSFPRMTSSVKLVYLVCDYLSQQSTITGQRQWVKELHFCDTRTVDWHSRRYPVNVSATPKKTWESALNERTLWAPSTFCLVGCGVSRMDTPGHPPPPPPRCFQYCSGSQWPRSLHQAGLSTPVSIRCLESPFGGYFAFISATTSCLSVPFLGRRSWTPLRWRSGTQNIKSVRPKKREKSVLVAKWTTQRNIKWKSKDAPSGVNHR